MRMTMCSLLAILSFQLQANGDFDRDQIQQRIRPIGNVHIIKAIPSEQVGPPAASVMEAGVTKAKPGQAIYEQYCSVCHRDGVAGAPKFQSAADWSPRQTKQTLDSLVATAIKGLNAMPAKGTCQECSEDDIKAAIQYMVPPS